LLSFSVKTEVRNSPHIWRGGDRPVSFTPGRAGEGRGDDAKPGLQRPAVSLSRNLEKEI